MVDTMFDIDSRLLPGIKSPNLRVLVNMIAFGGNY